MVIAVEYTGGFMDGRRISTDSEDPSEAQDAQFLYLATDNGTIGKGFKTYSDAGLHAMLTESLMEAAAKGFHRNHKYKIVERIEDAGNVLLRLEYAGQEG